MRNDSNEAWHNSGRRGSRFQCPYCRYTRNTKSQLEKHMKEHEEEVDDSSFTCDECPYKNNSRDQLNRHMKTAHRIKVHETKDSPQCTQCLSEFKTKAELLGHLKEKHINYKPCDYYNGPNNEDNCELDGECRFYHIKLKPGEQICYKCGKTFKSKKDLINHIKQSHGNKIYHRYLQNKCTERNCFFSHTILGTFRVPTSPEIYNSEDFSSLPAIRPSVGSQGLAHNNSYQVKTVYKMSE